MTTTSVPQTATAVPLHLSVDPWWTEVTLIAYGRTSDGLGPDCVVPDARGGRLAFFVEDGVVLGFKVDDPWSADLDAFDPEALWSGPRFEVPALGLSHASAGEVLLAVLGQYAEGEATADAIAFHAAIQADDREQAAQHFKLALEAGNMAAHYGLGYTLVELGRPVDGYQHLRRYTELVPRNAWAWTWLGHACVALEWIDEAKDGFGRALALPDGDETDAAEALEGLSET